MIFRRLPTGLLVLALCTEYLFNFTLLAHADMTLLISTPMSKVSVDIDVV